MEELNKRKNSNNEVASEADDNHDINQLLTRFDYENITRILSSSDDTTADSSYNNHKRKNIANGQEERDDISELTDTRGRNFENFKSVLIVNDLMNNDHQTEATSQETKINEVAIPVYSSRSSTSDPNQHDKEKALLLIPYLLRDYINAGDMVSSTNLINQNFAENCLFKTPALAKRKEGRKYIIEYFQSVLRCIPDVILTCGIPNVKCSTQAGRKFK